MIRFLVIKLCDSLERGYMDLSRIFLLGYLLENMFVHLGNIDLQLFFLLFYIMCFNWIFLVDFF